MTMNIAGTYYFMQQSSEPVHGQQSSSQPQVLLTTTHAYPVTTTASAAGTPLPPDIAIRQAGWWTRFWLFLGCVSIENEDNHH
jgi:hypothetical protein